MSVQREPGPDVNAVGDHPRPTPFSLRPPIAHNPRTTCTPKRDLLVNLDSPELGEQLSRKLSWWEPPHLCGGRSALALREKVSTIITRFSAGNAKAQIRLLRYTASAETRLPEILNGPSFRSRNLCLVRFLCTRNASRKSKSGGLSSTHSYLPPQRNDLLS